MTACAASWGIGHGSPWTFCVKERGHEGPHADFQGNPPNATLFEETPAPMEIEKEWSKIILTEAKKQAKRQ